MVTHAPLTQREGREPLLRQGWPRPGSLLDLSLMTGEVSYILSSEIELEFGLALDPLAGIKELWMDFTWSLSR